MHLETAAGGIGTRAPRSIWTDGAVASTSWVVKLALVGGTFEEGGGRPSGYVQRLWQALRTCGADVAKFVNGGTWAELASVADTIGSFDAVLWFADVSNERPKIVADIKVRWPKLYLVTSKRNLDGQYGTSEILGRALKTKSNLLVEMTGRRSAVESTIWDPLGSAYCLRETDIDVVADALLRRLVRLGQFKRVGCQSIGEGKRVEPPMTPELEEFYSLVREQAERFHEIIHGVGHERMMGNASFRCARGFPSFREGFLLFVSQRDVDKRFIGPEAFVAVAADAFDPVYYYGPVKPSVDTPIQVRLYGTYPRVRFMLHSHTYIEGAPMTAEPIPCGAVEEAAAVGELVPDGDAADFAVNLRGHGSIVLASKIETLRGQPWCARPVPDRAS